MPVTCACTAHRSAMPTVTVDAGNPANDIAQNGTTSRHRSLDPDRLHVQRRFNWYDGIVANVVVRTFAGTAATPNVVSTTRLTRLRTVVTTETDAQRRRRVTSGR